MEQGELTGLFSARPQNFAWFLGAGASRSAGLPTAGDIIWDLKHRYYCREENQEISAQDMQSAAVKARIQSYMLSRGFPEEGADNEYPAYFQKIFGADKERQRAYIAGILSEARVTLSVGNRVQAALLAGGFSRMVFTTNFDTVLERAVADVSGTSIAAFHLEGSRAACAALNNEEFPLYCKMHGDFRYDSIKNLPTDLAAQDKDLSDCLLTAASRAGFIIAGFSGHDESVMTLFHRALENPNPFPHGLYWTGIKGLPVPAAMKRLLDAAKAKGIKAAYVPIETYDSLMLRLWRNIEGKPPALAAKVSKSEVTAVTIPLPPTGSGMALVRMNALPITAVPTQCLALRLRREFAWDDLKAARRNAEGGLILTKTEQVLCWGPQSLASETFGPDFLTAQPVSLPANIAAPEATIVKGFLEEALCAALARDKPLLTRTNRASSWLIAAPHDDRTSVMEPLFRATGRVDGNIDGLFTPVDELHPHPGRIAFAEAVRVSIEVKNGRTWMLLDPDIWIWPPRARESAQPFLNQRRKDRFNRKYNELLSAWIKVLLGEREDGSAVTLSAFAEGTAAENPSFGIGRITAYAWRAS
ncbi:MAG: SIR2 family protein [Candidatus Hydrogenedentes bacterium]|nr:SIR2 family protein [Candidatus Hydrogenedentota bacterium]